LSAQLTIFLRDFAIFFGIQLIVALSLNLEYGYAGIPNFGKVLAVAGGAFTVGFLPGRVIAMLFNLGAGTDYIENNTAIITQVNNLLMENPGISLVLFLGTLLAAAGVGAVLGWIASYPAIRLREDYLSITLLAMGEAIQVIGYNYRPLIKGSLGVLVPDPFRWAGDQRYFVIVGIIVGICLLALFYLEKLVKSPLGRMLRAIRDNENVAESLGKEVTRTRMKTLIIASAIGAIAGAIDAFKAGGAHARGYQRVSWTFWPWVIVIMGGPANNVGVILGTFVFVALRRVIDFYKIQLEQFVPFSVVWLHSLLIGIMLIVVLLFRPEGILREKPTKTLNLERFKKPQMSETAPSTAGGNLLQKFHTILKNIVKRVSTFFKKGLTKPD
jgi:branched-chain amino acid transport system permease protein